MSTDLPSNASYDTQIEYINDEIKDVLLIHPETRTKEKLVFLTVLKHIFNKANLGFNKFL